MMRVALASLIMSLASAPAVRATDLSESFPIDGEGALRMKLDRGRVEVQRHDSKEVRIEARASGISAFLGGFTAARDGNDVSLEGSFSWSFLLVPWGPRVTVEAWVPANYSVVIETGGGAVTADGIVGRVVAHTHGGRVEVRDIDGPVSVETSGGAIEIASIRGSVIAQTSGGRIGAQHVVGNIEARTSGGAIELDDVDGRIEASTNGGQISASFVDEPEGFLQTSGGGIHVTFPKHAHVDLEAETCGGSISIDHEVLASERGGRRVVGRINGGGPTLRLHTSGGSIRVQAT